MPKGVYEPHAGIPEYNAAVIVEKAETFHAHKDTRYVERTGRGAGTRCARLIGLMKGRSICMSSQLASLGGRSG